MSRPPEPTWWVRERREGFAASRAVGIVLLTSAFTLITVAVLVAVHATRTGAWALAALALAGIIAAMRVDAARKRAGRR